MILEQIWTILFESVLVLEPVDKNKLLMND